jgi:putative oxidoreductase
MMESAPSSSRIAATILSVLLAVVFIAAALPKLIGTDPLLLETTAMRGFPGWIRTVVGIIQLAAAVGLLIPSTSAVAATLLALMMLPATITHTITQRVSGGTGFILPIVLFVMLVALAAMRRPDAVQTVWRNLHSGSHPIVRTGVIAGVIGATAIAMWFFIVDLVAGQPFFTPSALGRAVFSALGAGRDTESPMVHVAIYTVFHYAAFIVVGIVAAAMARLAGDVPSLLLGFGILFVAFEVGFYAFVAVLSQVTPLGGLAWWGVMLGHLIAAATMGLYLLRKHPALRQQFSHALGARPWRARAS